mmetsp:Transcript_3010/g.8200  ORF Transcript_3010/g.8200 Transcript_3010/m.8200 type:complete len:92 (+) Transcript_3010:134-409(+)
MTEFQRNPLPQRHRHQQVPTFFGATTVDKSSMQTKSKNPVAVPGRNIDPGGSRRERRKAGPVLGDSLDDNKVRAGIAATNDATATKNLSKP